jgi:predicted ATPase
MADNSYSRVPAVFRDRIDNDEAHDALDALQVWGIYEEKELYHAGLEWWIKLRDQRYAISLSMDISMGISMDICMDISFDTPMDIPMGYIHG